MRRSLAAVLLLALTSPAFAQLKIHDIKARHGHFGPERKTLDLHQGDQVAFTYAITGVATEKNGALNCEQQLLGFDAKGKPLLDVKTPIKQIPAFGSERVAAYATFSVGAKTPPGDYKLKVIFTDNLTGKSVSFEKKITCLKPDFAIIRPRFHYDKDGKSNASLTNVCGQQIFYRFAVAHFDRSQDKIHMEMTLQMLDEKGKAMMKTPIIAKAKTDDANVVQKNATVSFNGFFVCNQPGNFTLRITVADKVNDKTASFEAPIKVLD